MDERTRKAIKQRPLRSDSIDEIGAMNRDWGIETWQWVLYAFNYGFILGARSQKEKGRHSNG